MTKSAWSPDYNKQDYDPEDYTRGAKYDYPKGGDNTIPYEETANFPLNSKK